MDSKVYYNHQRILNKRTQYTEIHSHPFHELYFLISGKPKYLVGDKIFHVNTYDFVFISKGLLHKTNNLDYNACERILLFIEDSLFENEHKFLLEKLQESFVIKIPKNKINDILNIFKIIESESENDDIYANTIANHYTILLLSLLCRYKITEEKSEDQKNIRHDLFYEVSQHISKNFDHDLSLDSLSEIFHINKNYLCRKFKEIYGINIGDFIKSVRITNAEKLLNETTMSVTEISDKCGFNDPNYFSNIFKKVKGVTPFKYRKLKIN